MNDLKKRDSNQDKKPTGMHNVVALGFVSFFTDFLTEMILGILPLFIVTNLGASKEILGGIEGSAELISYAFRMISGALSDKLRKRKIFVIIGYGLSTISKPFFAISTVSESVSGKAFGIHRTIDQMGAIVGPVAAFALLHIIDIHGVFIVSLVPGAIAVIILIFVVKEVAINTSSCFWSLCWNFRDIAKSDNTKIHLVRITWHSIWNV